MDEPGATLDEVYASLLGMRRPETVEDGRVRCRLPVHPRLVESNGLVHGGVYPALAETLASWGTSLAVMDDGKGAFGQSNQTSFLRGIRGGTIHAEATALHRGRTTWVWDVHFRDDDGRLCAVTRMTMAVREVPDEWRREMQRRHLLGG